MNDTPASETGRTEALPKKGESLSMKYRNAIPASFVERKNRFVATVELNGHRETVHVKNTGRCREILLPGATVFLTEPGTAGRKYKYDLIAARKENGLLINLDSQAPNRVAAEWLALQPFTRILPEYRWGRSRLDFYMEEGTDRYLMEVKGCTLERHGIGYFPDAPTERGVRHIRELIAAREAGFRAFLAFVIQMDGIREVRTEKEIHPEFAIAVQEACGAGVEILFFCCHVEPDALTIKEILRR